MKYELLLLGVAHKIEGDTISTKQMPKDDEVLFTTELRMIALMSPVPHEGEFRLTREFRAKITVLGARALIGIEVQESAT